jgi:hypothetical protein
MKQRPVRGGCRRQLVAAALLWVLLAGCSDDGPGAEKETTAGSASSAAPVEPALCEADVVVSDKATETSEPLSVAEMQARLLSQPAVKPSGFTSQAVVVDEGLGSFRISTPSGYSTFWRNGTPAADLFEVAGPRDQAWVDFWQGQMEVGELNARAIAVDASKDDEVSALIITVTPGIEQAGDAMADVFSETYSAGGWTIREACGARANGADGAYIEHIVPAEVIGGPADRTQLQFLIPDPPNDALWGVTCDVTEKSVVEVKKTCLEIARTFEPLPPIDA